MNIDKPPELSRRKAAGILLLIFILGVTGLYVSYSPSLEVEISTTGQFTEDAFGQYRSFSYNITNTGDDTIRPEFWLVTPRDRGPRDTVSENISITPGETARINVSLADGERAVPFGSEYQLVVKDLNSGKRFSKLMHAGGTAPGKNPYFVKSDYYPYHWGGSSYGLGYYNVNSSGRGINASFRNCDQTGGCGFTYSDDYTLKPVIVVRGSAFNLGNSTELVIAVEDGEQLEIPVNVSQDTDFETVIELEKVYEQHGREFGDQEVVYSISFNTRRDSFHWINIEEFNFYSPK